MRNRGVISESTLAEARAEPIPQHRLALPFHAAHLAHAVRAADPHTVVQRTTIDPLLQRRVEALLRREAASLDPQATLAALVVGCPTASESDPSAGQDRPCMRDPAECRSTSSLPTRILWSCAA